MKSPLAFQWWPVVALMVIIGAWAYEVPVEQPSAAPASPTQVAMHITEQGIVYDGAAFASVTDLLPVLKQDAVQRPEIGVIISSASELPRERLVEVLHALQQAGITRTALSPVP